MGWKQDQLRARHRLTKFLLRTGRRPALGLKAWTERYMAWSYRHLPRVGAKLRKRQQGVPAEIAEIAWKAQNRLHKRYMKLTMAGKDQRKTMTAVARELLGFIWAIGIKAEAAGKQQMAA